MKGPRSFPAPWRVEQVPGGYKVVDAEGKPVAHVYARDTRAAADIANTLTMGSADRDGHRKAA